MRICHFEDRRVSDLAPLSLTRPVCDLLCGLNSIAEKQQQYFSADAVGYLIRPLVAELVRETRPHSPVNDPFWLRSGPTVLVNSRWVPPVRTFQEPAPTTRELFAEGPHLAVCEGELAYAALGTELLAAVSPNAIDDCLEDWLTALPRIEIDGHIIRWPWDLVDANGPQICADFPVVADSELTGLRPVGVSLIGSADQLLIDPSARVDPLVVIDTTQGPVIIGPKAVITSFTRLVGPCYIGTGTHVNCANVKGGTTIGPNCRIGGEIEASVIQGYTNKAHEGFLGHSYVGEWVNLAAGTYVSDLRNDYGSIRVMIDNALVNTDRMKVGSFIGDHTKTGIGVMLNCGSVVGPFACLLPTGKYMPREIPAFTRSCTAGITEIPDLEALFTTAETMMRRRNRILTNTQESLYRAVSAQTAIQRKRVLNLGDPSRHRKAS